KLLRLSLPHQRPPSPRQPNPTAVVAEIPTIDSGEIDSRFFSPDPPSSSSPSSDSCQDVALLAVIAICEFLTQIAPSNSGGEDHCI
ncbi:hypothetical protein TIFTF001_049115, partial [Ficus carica]